MPSGKGGQAPIEDVEGAGIHVEYAQERELAPGTGIDSGAVAVAIAVAVAYPGLEPEGAAEEGPP